MHRLRRIPIRERTSKSEPQMDGKQRRKREESPVLLPNSVEEGGQKCTKGQFV